MDGGKREQMEENATQIATSESHLVRPVTRQIQIQLQIQLQLQTQIQLQLQIFNNNIIITSLDVILLAPKIEAVNNFERVCNYILKSKCKI